MRLIYSRSILFFFASSTGYRLACFTMGEPTSSSTTPVTSSTATALTFFMFLAARVRPSAPEFSYCSAGQYRASNGACRPCPPGHFMSEAKHANPRCQPCTRRQGASDLLGCDPKHDTPVVCEFASYVDVNKGGLCTRCTDCSSRGMTQVRPCTKHSNTVCCPFLFMSLVNTSEAGADTARCMDTGRGGQFCCCPTGFTIDDQCQPKGSIRSDASPPRVGQSLGDVMCGYNQYWSSDKKKCQHCPLCSYISKPSHKESKCTPCSDSNNPRKAYCPKSCRDREANVLLRLVISGVIVVTFPLILVPLSLIIVDVAKKYDVI